MKKKKLLIDARVLVTHPNRGTAKNLQNYIDALSSSEKCLDFHIFKGFFRKNYSGFLALFVYVIEEQLLLPIYLIFKKYDFLLLPNQTGSIFPLRTKKIFIIHDVMFVENLFMYGFKGEMFLSSLYRTICIKVNCFFYNPIIISISETSKKRIQNYFSVKSQDINVIPNTIGEIKYEKQVNSIINKRYIFTVTGSAEHKNFSRLYEAFVKLNDSELFLVSVGNTKVKTNKSDNILQLNNITDNAMHSLYSNCNGFVFCSLDEGFGIPLLEAMIYNKPIACSNIEIFREIMGDIPIYMDPASINSIEDALRSLNTVIFENNKYSEILQKYNEKNIFKIINRFWKDIGYE